MESINIADRDMLFWARSPNRFNDSNSNVFIVNEDVKKGIEDAIVFAPLHNPAHLQGIKACELCGVPFNIETI